MAIVTPSPKYPKPSFVKAETCGFIYLGMTPRPATANTVRTSKRRTLSNGALYDDPGAASLRRNTKEQQTSPRDPATWSARSEARTNDVDADDQRCTLPGGDRHRG